MADVSIADMPFLDDPQAEIDAIIDEVKVCAENWAARSKEHYYNGEWAESRTASLLSTAYSGIALNLIASDGN